MTTTIKVQSHNYPALVETFVRGWNAEQNKPDEFLRKSDARVLKPADGEQSFYCTTSMEIRVVDLEYDDPRVPADAPVAVEAAPVAAEAAPSATIEPPAPSSPGLVEAAPAAPGPIVEPAAAPAPHLPNLLSAEPAPPADPAPAVAPTEDATFHDPHA